MASNYDDVLSQLRSAGLEVQSLELGKLTRCRVEGTREKRGWYHVHEMRLANGDDLIVGSYGIWRGAENNAVKIDIHKTEISQEQRASLRRRLAEDSKRAELVRKADADRAARRASAAWKKCAEDGDCAYLHRKGVGAHGIRFSPTSGAMVIPMLDTANNIHGLQIIRGDQKGQGKLGKEFWPSGLIKKGHFHLIGLPGPLLLIAEGYATAASLYEATGIPVAVAFDAGNLAPVATALRKRYKKTRMLICADDDAFSQGNPGVTCASAAALEVGGAYVAPVFSNEVARREAYEAKGEKITDFNDLHMAEGLHVVRAQVQARISELGWTVTPAAARPSTAQGEGSEEKQPLRPIDSLDELLERFSLVYGQGGTVFDHQEHCLVALSDMRDACVARELHRSWAENPDRHLVRADEVGFDPAGTDRSIHCNLWSGWPTVPKAGRCENLLDLLRYMCAGDSKPEELFLWCIRWLAYPIQHPGAKMKTTLVIHGPQGTGKNMFFEAIMDIYGRYGRVIDQSAIEDKFNDWASRKLFLIADEVLARSELYHVKNKLKAFITGEWIRINPKNMAAYEEKNHVNMVFLSNEAMPVVLEEDDRRHAVIWTPEKLSREFYASVRSEIEDGGIPALHDYLLHLDLGDFGPATLPPMTDAKRELIDLSLDSPSRFMLAFESGDVEGFPGQHTPKLLSPCLSQDLFDLYCEWCRRVGLKALNQPRFANALKRKHGANVERKRYDSETGIKGPSAIAFLKGGHEMPPGRSESEWIGERVGVFKMALKDFKGMGGVGR
jgi:putative DNA primase/helicase